MNDERDKGKARKRVNEDEAKAKKEKNLFVCPWAGQSRPGGSPDKLDQAWW